MTQYRGVCGFFLSVKFATSLTRFACRGINHLCISLSDSLCGKLIAERLLNTHHTQEELGRSSSTSVYPRSTGPNSNHFGLVRSLIFKKQRSMFNINLVGLAYLKLFLIQFDPHRSMIINANFYFAQNLEHSYDCMQCKKRFPEKKWRVVHLL